MPWLEIHINTVAEHAKMLEEELFVLGAEAVTMQDAGDQPIYEPALHESSLWQETTVIGLFAHDQDSDPIIHSLKQHQANQEIKNFYVKHLADQDWVRASLKNFQPLQFGKRLWVCPSWHTPPNPNSVNVILDPGLAFGTGTHETTHLCLEWLEQHIQSQSCLIDYGCGSGILGIAALKLGAKHVIAVDHDSQALEATRHNAERNGLSTLQLETLLPSQPIPQKADILIANILAKPLIDLSYLFSSLLKPHGEILLSGILRDQVEEVVKAYQPWFNLKESTFKNEWACLFLETKEIK